MFKRLLLMELPPGQSAFLWGARQTGKSTYLKSHYKDATYIDLLKSDIFLELNKKPSLLRERMEALLETKAQHLIIIDEVQKIPPLLDEVHCLIENAGAQFILCGSSARKLKRSGVNLLGGRAWKYHFYPLTTREIPAFDLLTALNQGLVPTHYLSKNPQKSLQAYIEDYLTHEIKEEGLVRSLPNFSRFLDAMAFCNGEMINYTNIARDCGVDAKTVQNYFDILVDTLLGNFLLPYKKRVNRAIINEMPKFYLFDTGVANYLSNTSINALKGKEAGKSFEQFIFMELLAYKGLNDKRFSINYWRTRNGLEVDFILNQGNIALEIKIAESIHKEDLRGLIAFTEEHSPKSAIVICQEKTHRKITINEKTIIDVMPWQLFLEKLWSNEIV